jgi:ribose/xylose/arabinose/galactoside ABC-type transport system permease subunit
MTKIKNIINNKKIGNALSFDNIGLIVSMIVMAIIFTSLNGNFFSTRNFINILVSASIVGLVAIAETYLIIGGQVDLSPGATVALSSVLIAVFITTLSVNPIIAIIIVLFVGALVGALNATAVNVLKIEPFIATLATMSIVRGFAYIAVSGRPVYILNESFLNIGRIKILGLPISVVVLILAFVVAGFILAKTVFGRNIYVIGGNKVAARLAGINSKMMILKLYIISGVLASIGGILLSSRMTSGQPQASVGLEFDAITAAVLGGTAFSGGVGKITGTVLGVILLQGFNTGLIMVNVPTFWQNVARGALLLIALAFDFYRRKKRQNSKIKKTVEENK